MDEHLSFASENIAMCNNLIRCAVNHQVFFICTIIKYVFLANCIFIALNHFEIYSQF